MQNYRESLRRWRTKVGGELMILSRTIIAILSTMIATSAIAQSGSTGGSLGKKNKSVSGSIKKPVVSAKRKPILRKQSTDRQTPTNIDIDGMWKFRARCGALSVSGNYNFQSTGAGLFIGNGRDMLGVVRMVTNGKVRGDRVSWTFQYTDLIGRQNIQTVAGRFVGSNLIKGDVSGGLGDGCTVTVRR